MINNDLFYCKNKDTYPPFKNGFYKEEYFLMKYLKDKPKTYRIYIPALWTNFQIEGWFNHKIYEMQQSLDEWIKNNPSEEGYFTIVQYDDGCLLKLPENTLIYGSCSGSIPIPLIYEDTNSTLEKLPKKRFNEKEILCSFVGNITGNHLFPNVRKLIIEMFKDNSNFKLIYDTNWSPIVNKNKQDDFIKTSINSKFGLAPRGYGRNSFRFFELFKLGTIPIYVWNDIDWLPFKDEIDYSRLCININYNELKDLETILLNINEEKYNNMLKYYETIKHLFTVEGLYEKILDYDKHIIMENDKILIYKKN